jgi:superfamily I DNA/RNA helicase
VLEADDNALWRRCEDAWARWLDQAGQTVMHYAAATGNTEKSAAPLIMAGGVYRRAPDLAASSQGQTQFWEVKTRSRSDVDPLTGQHQHWMDRAAFSDYLAISEHAQMKVWIVLFEPPAAVVQGRWLRIDVRRMRDVGHQANRRAASGRIALAWVWPVEEMDVIEGPAVDVTNARDALLPEEGGGEAVDPGQLQPIERRLRHRKRRTNRESARTEHLDDGAGHWLEAEPAVALDVLRRSLGVPHLPRYSVLRVGLDDVDVDDLLALMHYGIRVFVISTEVKEHALEPTEIEAFTDARMLEWAVVPEAAGCSLWIVDGQVPDNLPGPIRTALVAADDIGDVNLAQYYIVHADPGADVVVRAGAGTGKTETMAERIAFLLATANRDTTSPGSRPHDLRADDIALVTFTRESAAEMRNRIARTLLLRQRLCRSCALPVLAWMLQLSSADITTIHSLAKRVVGSSAAVLGFGPDVRVARRTLEVRDATNRALSQRIERLVDQHKSKVPAAYEWQRHVQTVWEALENNGVDLLRLVETTPLIPDVDWGTAPSNGLEQAAVDATREAVEQVAREVRAMCLDSQTLPTNQLVPSATAALKAQDYPPVRSYRYLFVDEFQDTDASQMELMLELRTRVGSRLFVVGDAKQGIYRFRGAEGNAFEEMQRRVEARGLHPMTDFSLTRNFRSGERLLGSMHPYFQAWGDARLLPYVAGDRLRPRRREHDPSTEVSLQTISKKQFAQEAARTVSQWREASGSESIGVLCRQNWQAVAVRDAVRDAGLPCEIRVGGSFFETRAVREMRVLLEAVCDPSDDAALLELCETRWAAALLSGEPPADVPVETWGPPVEPPMSWRPRFAALATADDLPREDLERLRQRVGTLRMMSARMPALAWVAECERSFRPGSCEMPGRDDETERRRYGRCLDHLVTLLDSHFQDGAVTLERLLSWVRVQVAINRNEDEPDAETDGKIVALTVHKAKGAEFDRVVIASTATSFGPPKTLATRTSVLHDGRGGTPRLLWKWRPAGGLQEMTNVPLARQHEWRTDDRDNAMEEARLLYVAMTRAKEELVVQVTGSGGTLNSPDSWGDLLGGVR